jgi:glycosyltransferase involved in cell wall biosynthesis
MKLDSNARPKLMVLTTIDATMLAFLQHQMRELASSGYEVHAVTSPGSGLAQLRDFATTHAIPMARPPAPLRDLVSLVRLVLLMLRVRPQIVHAHTPKAGLLGMLAAFLTGVQVRLYTIHGLPLETRSGLKRRILEAAERAASRFATQVYAVSPSLAQVVTAARLCAPEKLSVVGVGSCDGVDVARFDPSAISSGERAAIRTSWGLVDDSIAISFVGRLARDKGIEYLATAWQLLADRYPRAHLVLCGPEDVSDPVDPQVLAMLRAHPRVLFLGLQRASMPTVYAASDVCVLPTFREGLPQVVLEASAMGLPVVGTCVTGVRDAIVPDVTGALIPARNAEALRDALARMLAAPEVRARLGRAGRSHVLAHFDATYVRNLWMQEYARMLGLRAPQRRASGVAALSIVILTILGACWPGSAQSPSSSATTSLFHEFVAPRVFETPEVTSHLSIGLANGVTFAPPIDTGMATVTAPFGANVMVRLAATPSVAALPAATLDREYQLFRTIAAANPRRSFFWNLMPEWDQSGGQWVANGRPSYLTKTREEAHSAFLAFYRTQHPELTRYLTRAVATSPLLLTAVTDHSPNTFYTYDIGADVCLLERGIDELGDIATGIAFVRGAGVQYGKAWGIDLAPWRTGTDSATHYDSQDRLLGGWSASYLRRHYYTSYMAGAHLIQTQGSELYTNEGRYSPFGEALAEVADFMLRRHPNPGTPVVPTALLLDHYNGFDPKHGVFNQDDHVWYQDIEYSPGDFMTDQLLRVAFPNHWLHGLAPGAPFAASDGVPDTGRFKTYLASGGDPHPYEPMPTTRWGETINVITNRASRTSLDRYKVIVLTGDVRLDSRLRADLLDWVTKGGTLVMNAMQVSPGDEPMIGAIVQNATATTSASRWLPTLTRTAENTFRFRRVTMLTAGSVAVTDGGDPLVTRNSVGAGEVWLTTPEYMLSSGRRMLHVGIALLDHLAERESDVLVDGPAISYLVNQAPTGTVVTLINNTSTRWTGNVVVAGSARSVSDWVTDKAVPFTSARNLTAVYDVVDPWDVHVIAFDQPNAPAAKDRRRRL